jgi:2-keto-4-pentenoate hydratase/2-oxohepta-3-ene-1,7-dioic acid hydratase in catechol pathway
MFGVGSFESGAGDAFPGLVVAERVLDLRSHFGPTATTGELLASWDASLGRLRKLSEGGLDGAVPLGELRPLPPVQPPGQLFCAGANYGTHLAQIAAGEPSVESAGSAAAAAAELVRGHSDGGTPFIFAMPAGALSGARDDIVLWGPGGEHDWELELALVIGRRARNVRREEAMSFVAGYTVSNDISTRDLLVRPGLPLTDFLMSKGRPGFFPTGPYLVPREFVEDYRRLRISLRVNGRLMQDDLAGNMIFGLEDLVSYASSITELQPGDIVLTGSPGGNARHHGNRWLRPGDLVEGEIAGIGVIRNRCVAPVAPGPEPAS